MKSFINALKIALPLWAFIMLVMYYGLFIMKAGNHYSPLDTYIEAMNQRHADSLQSVKDAKRFIDSINIHQHCTIK